jgi:hypothetical protein
MISVMVDKSQNDVQYKPFMTTPVDAQAMHQAHHHYLSLLSKLRATQATLKQQQADVVHHMKIMQLMERQMVREDAEARVRRSVDAAYADYIRQLEFRPENWKGTLKALGPEAMAPLIAIFEEGTAAWSTASNPSMASESDEESKADSFSDVESDCDDYGPSLPPSG